MIHHARKRLIEQVLILFPDLLGISRILLFQIALPSPVIPTVLALVIATPQCYTGMISQAFNIHSISSDRPKEALSLWVSAQWLIEFGVIFLQQPSKSGIFIHGLKDSQS